MTMLNVVPGDLARQLLLLGAGLALGAVAGWWVNGWRWEARLADADKLHASTLGEISRVAAAQLQASQQQQAELQQRLALLDQQRYQELTHAQEQQSRLRADLAASARRMYVPVTAASCQQLPTAPGAAGLDDGAYRAELHPAAAADLAHLAGDADTCARRLRGLQEWVRGMQGYRKAGG
ncbi:lysis system i-spanin subunit Rz [Pseudomonas tohonis]|nr:lysis system i-spanin subunit Rz [Pseudomonas tohonis]